MAVQEPAPATDVIIDKKWLREQFAAMDAQTGFAVDPTMTVEKMRELMLVCGIRPEKNEFSREILRDRHPDDFPPEQD